MTYFLLFFSNENSFKLQAMKVRFAWHRTRPEIRQCQIFRDNAPLPPLKTASAQFRKPDNLKTPKDLLQGNFWHHNPRQDLLLWPSMRRASAIAFELRKTPELPFGVSNTGQVGHRSRATQFDSADLQSLNLEDFSKCQCPFQILSESNFCHGK